MAHKNAFTLVEVVVVVAIISILAAITRPVYERFVDKATMLEAKTKLIQVYLLEKTFFAEYSQYHENLLLVGFPNSATYELTGHIENGGITWSPAQTSERYGVSAGFNALNAVAPPGAPISMPADIASCIEQSGCPGLGLGGYDGLVRSGSGCQYGSNKDEFQNALAVAGLTTPATNGPYATPDKFRGAAVGCSPSTARFHIFTIDDEKSLIQQR